MVVLLYLMQPLRRFQLLLLLSRAIPSFGALA